MVINSDRQDLLAIFKDKGLKFHEEIGNFRYCPTGEPYLTVVSAGIKKEGAKARLFKTEAGAFNAWNKIIGQITKQLTGNLTVYWRKMPEMKLFEPKLKSKRPPDDNGERWTVYSRFKISNKPVIQSADYKKIAYGLA